MDVDQLKCSLHPDHMKGEFRFLNSSLPLPYQKIIYPDLTATLVSTIDVALTPVGWDQNLLIELRLDVIDVTVFANDPSHAVVHVVLFLDSWDHVLFEDLGLA